MQFPNGVGSFLAFCQLLLFIVLPRKPKQRAPIVKLFFFVRRCGAPTEKDIEQRAVVKAEKEAQAEPGPPLARSKRWSKRLAASVASVTSEIEDAMSKVQMGGQFGYSAKLNVLEELPNEPADSFDSAIVETALGWGAEKKVSFPLTITSEAQLIELSRQLVHKLSMSGAVLAPEPPRKQADRAPLPPHFEEPELGGAGSSSSRLERCASEPDLNKANGNANNSAKH